MSRADPSRADTGGRDRFGSGPRSRRRKGDRGAEELGDILSRILRRRFASEGRRTAELRASLEAFLGSDRARQIQIRGVRDGRLTLAVSSAPLRHELESFYSHSLLGFLQSERGRPDIRTLRFLTRG